MITVEVIPYRTFRERIRIVKELLQQENTFIEVYKNYIYVEIQN